MAAMTHHASGTVYAASAYVAWGLLPLYWRLLEAVPATEILAHRIFWSFIFTASILALTGGWRTLPAAFAEKRKLAVLLASGVLISFNWYTYIWAVNSGFVIQASMGYYIAPLVSVLLGVTVLKEHLTRWQAMAAILAALGVTILTVQYGQIPWVALILAFSFSLYGLAKKFASVGSVTGLAVETSVVTPVAAFYIAFLAIRGSSAPAEGLPHLVLLAGAGVVTALPLLFFAHGAKRIKLSTIGFLQYIAPTLTLMLGIFVFQEHFSTVHLISFGFIWTGLALYTASNFRSLQRYSHRKQGQAG